MKTFKVQCKCGETSHANLKDVGQQIECRRCGRLIELRGRRDPSRATPNSPRSASRHATRNADKVKKVRHGPARWEKIVYRIETTVGRPVAKVARWLWGMLAIAARYVRDLIWAPKRAKPRSPYARYVELATWIYLAMALLIAALIWGLGDRWWPATIVLFMGRWIFLLPLIALVPAAALYRRLFLIPIAIAAAIVLGPVMGYQTGWRNWFLAPNGTRVRVVTFNADDGEQLASQLPYVLAEWDADIIAIQECGTALIAATETTQWYHHNEHGLCLLTRYPIRGTHVMDRSAFEAVKLNEAAGIGGSADIVRYDLQTPQGLITFANLHLETPRKGLEGLAAGLERLDVHRLKLNTELRDIESAAARRWVDEGELPALVVGDFNTPIESRIFQSHWGDFDDAFVQAGKGLGMSKYNGWIRVRIDHILMSAGWHANSVTIGRDLGSDHRPVIADLTMVDYK